MQLLLEYRNDLCDLGESYAQLEKQFTTQNLFKNKTAENNFSPAPLKNLPYHREARVSPPIKRDTCIAGGREFTQAPRIIYVV